MNETKNDPFTPWRFWSDVNDAHKRMAKATMTWSRDSGMDEDMRIALAICLEAGKQNILENLEIARAAGERLAYPQRHET